MSLPLFIFRGVKSNEALPRGASSAERRPLPGREDSDVGVDCGAGCALRIEPILIPRHLRNE